MLGTIYQATAHHTKPETIAYRLPYVTNLNVSLCDEHIYNPQKTEYKNAVSDKEFRKMLLSSNVNPLTPNDSFSGRTAPLISKRYILYIYSTNIGTEYFKHNTLLFFFKIQFVS